AGNGFRHFVLDPLDQQTHGLTKVFIPPSFNTSGDYTVCDIEVGLVEVIDDSPDTQIYLVWWSTSFS
ncbi:MAG: hypothetical protein ACREX3_21535, partial [Gammaproteobacteria bacterium]